MDKRYKIYTKTGDDGTTGLLGGSRVKKYNIRLEAYGTVDELNAAIGVIRSCNIPAQLSEYLVEIQNKLFNIGSRLASDGKGRPLTEKLLITDQQVEFIEKAIDELESGLPALAHFILPGGDLAAAQCHVARTICRRAERRILEFAEQEEVHPEILKYINRLSDLLFVLARKLSAVSGTSEIAWRQF